MKQTKNKEKLQDPQTKFYHEDFSKQKQPWPGLDCEMNPIPDCGEKSYVGHGRLKGRKALITGGFGYRTCRGNRLCQRGCRCSHQLFAIRRKRCRRS